MKTSKLLLYLSITLLILTQCNKNKNQMIKNQFDFISTYEGVINGKYNIVMKIICDSNQIEGSYYYVEKGVELSLKGIINQDSTLKINEFDNNGNQTGEFNGKLINENKIQGKWKKPIGGNELNFKLISSNIIYGSNINPEPLPNFSGNYHHTFNSGKANIIDATILFRDKKTFTFILNYASQNFIADDVSGLATMINKNTGKFSTQGCEFIFVFDSNSLQISQKDCFNETGRANFDGRYIKEN